MSTDYGPRLRRYRRMKAVSQEALARALGFGTTSPNAAAISRRERGETPMTKADFAEAVAAIERIAEERHEQGDPAGVIEEG